jgi:uncharacterized protein (TIGR04255 family)
MPAASELPSFNQPPLDEVAAGMQFLPLSLKTVDVGAYHALLAAEYPNTLDVPALPPTFETFGAVMVPPITVGVQGGLLPRCWFISANDEHVVQLQSDRLLVNWRMRPSGGAYPRFPEVRRRFVAATEALQHLCRERTSLTVVPNQCELTYFNKVPLPAGAEWGDFDRLLSGLKIAKGPEWARPFSDGRVALRSELRDEHDEPFARLQIDCTPAQIDLSQKVWTLNISVRGRPLRPEFEDVLNFLDRAHREIVTCFAAITTKDMHLLWGRQR